MGALAHPTASDLPPPGPPPALLGPSSSLSSLPFRERGQGMVLSGCKGLASMLLPPESLPGFPLAHSPPPWSKLHGFLSERLLVVEVLLEPFPPHSMPALLQASAQGGAALLRAQGPHSLAGAQWAHTSARLETQL